MPDYCETAVLDYHCNPDEEQQWLVDLYQSTNADKQKNNAKWTIINNDTSYCDWYGIHCCDTVITSNQELQNTTTNNNLDREYTKLAHKCLNMLDLNSNDRSGTLPSYWPNSTIFSLLSIGNEGSEENSDGTFNYTLSGTIASFRYKLPSLAYIDLGRQNFNVHYLDFVNQIAQLHMIGHSQNN